MSKPRILHVVGSLEIGGGQKLTALVAAGLREAGYEVAVLNLGRRSGYAADLERRGIPVRHLGMSMRLSWRTIPSTMRGLIALWSALLSRPRWDIVHTHMFRTSLLVAVPARIAGSRLFGTMHRVYYRWQPAAERLLAPLHEAIVVDSAAVGRILQESTRIPARRYAVVYNGIDPAEFEAMPTRSEARRVLEIDEPSTVIAEIAHLVPHKGQANLLEAFARVEGGPVLLLLVGDGPDRADLEAHAERLGITSRVRFLGERSDLSTVLAAIDVLALPSTFEGFGLVQAEAMYAGVPVVAGDRGGSTEVVADGVTGFLVTYGDVDALADRLQRLVDDPELRHAMGRAGRERVVERFTLDAMTASYERLYARDLPRGFGST